MTIETVGVDIAKNVFQLHGVNCNGRVVLRRRVMRDGLLLAIAQINRCTIVLEACTGAFFWARKFEALGHQVKVISPQYVKPFVRRQKNDGNDANPRHTGRIDCPGTPLAQGAHLRCCRERGNHCRTGRLQYPKSEYDHLACLPHPRSRQGGHRRPAPSWNGSCSPGRFAG